MTELGQNKFRCDRCFIEEPGLPELGLGDPFIRDVFEKWEQLKWSIEIVEMLDLAAKEGQKIKRQPFVFCTACLIHFEKDSIYEVHFCPKCWKEIEEINGMGNSAISQECVTCRAKIETEKNELINLKAKLEVLEEAYPGLKKGARSWEEEQERQREVVRMVRRKNPEMGEIAVMLEAIRILRKERESVEEEKGEEVRRR
jgi:hypothetical protein